MDQEEKIVINTNWNIFLKKINPDQNIFELCEKLQVNFNPYYYRLLLPNVHETSMIRMFQKRFIEFLDDKNKKFYFVEIPKISLTIEQKQWFESKKKAFQEIDYPFHFSIDSKKKGFELTFFTKNEIKIKTWFEKYFSKEENPYCLSLDFLTLNFENK
jgi:hypothetical protein